MSKSKSTLGEDAHRMGMEAYYAGQPRTACPVTPDMTKLFDLGLNECWEMGWDTGLFSDAFKAGVAAPADAVCPYAHPETAAHWVQGWRINHDFAVIRGKKKPG